jgi:uncharacterized membrane protein YesL
VTKDSLSDLIRETLVDSYFSFTALATVNLLWTVFTLLIFTALPAVAGLYYTTNQLAHGTSIRGRTFLKGLRDYFWVGWLWGIINALVFGVLGFYFWFMGETMIPLRGVVRGLCIGLGILWILAQIYTFPLLFEQDDMRIGTALRNSLVLLLRRPHFTLALSLFVLLLSVITTLFLAPLWLIFTPSLLTYLVNRATLLAIKDMREHARGDRAEEEED